MKEMSGERQQPPPPTGDPLKCPRCNSFDTKFCYYNNYSTTQPRHFCKNCKRYWTAGGSLRNVPVGGGLRKNKKAKLAKQQQQQGSEMASASSDEHFHASNPRHGMVNPNSNTDGFPYSDSTRGPFMLGSPSSSADAGALDENLTNCNGTGLQYSVPPNYRYLDTPIESYYGGDYTSSGFSNPYLGARNGTEFFGGSDLLAKGSQQQQQQKDGGYGNFKRRRVMPDGSTEPGTDATEYCDVGLSANNLHQTTSQDSMAMLPQWQQNYYESSVSQAQNGIQSSAEELVASQNGKSRTNRSGVEEEDEGLGNVVNVRYPYDWDQVSEVLFGGTPDFFQMPGF